MDPNTFNPDQNPFEEILAQGGGQAPAQEAPQQPMIPHQGPPAPGVPPEALGPEELQPGKTGDNSKPLLGAIQSLHSYIAMSSDQGTIQLVRNLISALTQLVARDQKASEEASIQQQQQMSQGEQGGAPMGAPAGPPTM